MTQSYLIIWQLGNNDQSKTETPIDVTFEGTDTAEEKYEKILRHLEQETDEYDSVSVLGLFKI